MISIVLGAIGLVWNSMESEEFDAIVGGISASVGGLSLWRIRKFGRAQAVMDSVDELKDENGRLHEQIIDLEAANGKLTNVSLKLQETNNSLCGKLDNMRKLLGIFDKNNKTAEAIQDDMISTLVKLEHENEKYEKLNRGHAFLVADSNHDGKLNNQEQGLLKTITSNENLVKYDKDHDENISRTEYMTF